MFAIAGNKPIYLEVKDYSEDLLEIVGSLIKTYKRTEITVRNYIYIISYISAGVAGTHLLPRL